MRLFAGPLTFQFLCLRSFRICQNWRVYKKQGAKKKTSKKAWNKVREAGERHLTATLVSVSHNREGLIRPVKSREREEGGDAERWGRFDRQNTATLKSVPSASSLSISEKAEPPKGLSTRPGWISSIKLWYVWDSEQLKKKTKNCSLSNSSAN